MRRRSPISSRSGGGLRSPRPALIGLRDHRGLMRHGRRRAVPSSPLAGEALVADPSGYGSRTARPRVARASTLWTRPRDCEVLAISPTRASPPCSRASGASARRLHLHQQEQRRWPDAPRASMTFSMRSSAPYRSWRWKAAAAAWSCACPWRYCQRCPYHNRWLHQLQHRRRPAATITCRPRSPCAKRRRCEGRLGLPRRRQCRPGPCIRRRL
mmetsp:Transcript_37477/g.84593  ORF Transcript_37477/g.84593 Transcript_37477/m.84593 type:complete len:213 (-) Transcript_37477:14-652(-)